LLNNPSAPVVCFDAGFLSVRLLLATDQKLYRQLFTSKAVMQWIGEPLTDSQLTCSFAAALQQNLAASTELKPNSRLFLTITDPAANTTPGLMAVTFNTSVHANRFNAEIGIMLLPFAQGKGLAVTALISLCQRLLQLPQVIHIICRITDGNLAAIKLVSELGFVYCKQGNYYKLHNNNKITDTGRFA
tara:strand:- start:50447 stop:51010 length:564 start_codon:yes stop_codon:yes gene_type:complete